MRIHEIKIQHCFFDVVESGEKTFEIRYDDRGYQSGDFVDLIEVSHNNLPSGKRIKKKIGFVTAFKQQENWVVFSLLDP